MTDQADTVSPTTPQVAAKLAAEKCAANLQGSGDAIGGAYPNEKYLGEMAKEREDSRQRNARDQRLLVFAEILRARPDLSPGQAADAAKAVYTKLTD